MKIWRPGSRVECRPGMALQAQDIQVARLQQPRVRGAMRHVARHASFRPSSLVFKNKWPLLVHVTSEANSVPRCGGAQLFADESAVRVMAIRTFH